MPRQGMKTTRSAPRSSKQDWAGWRVTLSCILPKPSPRGFRHYKGDRSQEMLRVWGGGGQTTTRDLGVGFPALPALGYHTARGARPELDSLD